MVKITMSAPEAIAEHEHLVAILRGGKRTDMKREAEKQEKELEEYRKKVQRKARAYNRLDKGGRREKDRR